MHLFRVTTVLSLLLSCGTVFAQAPVPNLPLEKIQKTQQGGTPTGNPFDIPDNTASKPSVTPNANGQRTFYRAGKEATPLPQATNVAPEALQPENIAPDLEPATENSEAPNDQPETPADPSIDETMPEEEAMPNANEPTTAEDIQHGSAPSVFSMFGNLGNMAQYAGIAVACIGAVFLFLFKRKKKIPASRISAEATASSVENTPLDSERVKKALAAFHEEAPTQSKDALAETITPPAGQTSMDGDSIKQALAAFHDAPPAQAGA